MKRKKKSTHFRVRAKVLFLSWIIQIIFALWVFLLFVVFAKMDHGADTLAEVTVDESAPQSVPVFPAGLIAPNPPTE